MLSLDPDWHAFSWALIEHRVCFLVICGIALAIHAEPRFTKVSGHARGMTSTSGER